MKRIILVHGWAGSPDTNWLPWLKAELERKGYEVVVPEMPDTDTPVIDAWVSHLAEVVGVPDAETYLIGHSVGCQAILRYLETVETAVGGALFVAGWFNLEGLEEGEEEEIARPWIDMPINLGKVKSVLLQSTLLISDNDPWGAFQENRKRFKEFITKEVVVPGGEHFTEKEEQAVLAEALSLIQ
jgi:hypothetical protein